MLFKDISSIKKKAEKKNQFELVSIYCKIVRQLACKLAIPFTLGAEVSEKIIDELFEIGIISSKIQIPDLEKQLGVLYNEFISSIAVYVENKRSFGNTLDKLYTKKRIFDK